MLKILTPQRLGFSSHSFISSHILPFPEKPEMHTHLKDPSKKSAL